MALAMEGIWEVAMPPITVAMSFPRVEQLCPERFDRHAGLFRAEILDIAAVDSGKFGQVIAVATGRDQLQHVAALHRGALLRRQVELVAIGVFVGRKFGAVRRVVEGEAHLVESVALLRHRSVEDRRAGNDSATFIVHGVAPRANGRVADRETLHSLLCGAAVESCLPPVTITPPLVSSTTCNATSSSSPTLRCSFCGCSLRSTCGSPNVRIRNKSLRRQYL